MKNYESILLTILLVLSMIHVLLTGSFFYVYITGTLVIFVVVINYIIAYEPEEKNE
jgi:hypothetical protein